MNIILLGVRERHCGFDIGGRSAYEYFELARFCHPFVSFVIEEFKVVDSYCERCVLGLAEPKSVFEALQFFLRGGERGLLVRDVELHNLFAFFVACVGYGYLSIVRVSPSLICFADAVGFPWLNLGVAKAVAEGEQGRNLLVSCQR